MLPRPARLSAFLCLVLLLHLAFAHNIRLVRRQEESSSITDRPSPSSSDATDISTSLSSTVPSTNSRDGQTSRTQSPSATESSNTPPPSSASSTSTATASGNATIPDSGFFNATIPAGTLPLTPELTPGWGVAGIIMLITGLIYALVGIKNQWIHTFFSTAYSTALGITLLIVYVMNVPVSNALQGGYVVAVVMSSGAVGAASLFFKELTEGLGCALGGFCVSMWLLCLAPGGLLRSIAAKAVFISCFTIVAFAFYFSRWTRDWALIAMIAFSGATITVLGIDCFSRAGLKEFWAYVWNINDKLFPLGADTYPITKGIRVETAAVIIIFLVGVMSQIKLWRIVRQKREQRAAERAEDQRNLELEEENVGRQVEEDNARERRRWEQIYGDGTLGSTTASRTSDAGEFGSEKRLKDGHTVSVEPLPSVEVVEMRDVPESLQPLPASESALMNAKDSQDGTVTVRVAADDAPEMVRSDGNDEGDQQDIVTTEALAGNGQLSREPSAAGVGQAPKVVPLPFTVPAEDDSRSRISRSSVATFADDIAGASPARHRLQSPANQSGPGSTTPRGSISHISDSVIDEALEEPEHDGIPEELAVYKTPRVQGPDNESLAATIDEGSVSDDMDVPSVHSGGLGKADSAETETAKESTQVDEKPSLADRSQAPAGHSVDPQSTDKSTEEEKKPTTASQGASSDPFEPGQAAVTEGTTPGSSEKPKSTASVLSTPASLTKERLPRPLSRVAMSYRTNEWAKHLSYADKPELDELQLEQNAQQVKGSSERTAPVLVEELQKTAADGSPPAAVRHSNSQTFSTRDSLRRNSKMEAQSRALREKDVLDQSMATPSPANLSTLRSSSAAALRRTTSMGFEPIIEERAAPVGAQPIPEEDDATEAMATPPDNGNDVRRTSGVPGVVSYTSPQTLIGQREMFLRSKSQGNLFCATPEPSLGMLDRLSDSDSVQNYPTYVTPANNADPDDLPLSKRKQILRQSSILSMSHQNAALARLTGGPESTENLAFNSHQPKRTSILPTQGAREAQLASFRQSVQQDLRSGTPVMNSSGRETPFASTTLLGSRELEVQRQIEMQRNVMMGQKEAEAQRHELRRREKEFASRVFDERMRSGDLLEAHREAMRKMQKGAR